MNRKKNTWNTTIAIFIVMVLSVSLVSAKDINEVNGANGGRVIHYSNSAGEVTKIDVKNRDGDLVTYTYAGQNDAGLNIYVNMDGKGNFDQTSEMMLANGVEMKPPVDPGQKPLAEEEIISGASSKLDNVFMKDANFNIGEVQRNYASDDFQKKMKDAPDTPEPKTDVSATAKPSETPKKEDDKKEEPAPSTVPVSNVDRSFGYSSWHIRNNKVYLTEDSASKHLGDCVPPKCDRFTLSKAYGGNVIDHDGKLYSDKTGKNQIGEDFSITDYGYEFGTGKIDGTGEDRFFETEGRTKVFTNSKVLDKIEHTEPEDGEKETKYYLDGEDKPKTLEEMEDDCDGSFALLEGYGGYYCDGTSHYGSGASMKETTAYLLFDKKYEFTDPKGNAHSYDSCVYNGGKRFCEDADGNVFSVSPSGVPVKLKDEEESELFSDGLIGGYGMYHFGSALDYWTGATSNKFGGLASLFYDDDVESDYLGLMDNEFTATVLGGMDTWTSYACQLGVQDGADNGYAFSFGNGEAYAHIEGERIKYVNYSEESPVTQYIYKITFDVNSGDCDMSVEAFIDGTPLFSKGWELGEDENSISFAGASAIFDWSTTMYDEVCIKFKSITPNCLAGIRNGGEICNRIVDGTTTADNGHEAVKAATTKAGSSGSSSGPGRNRIDV